MASSQNQRLFQSQASGDARECSQASADMPTKAVCFASDNLPSNPVLLGSPPAGKANLPEAFDVKVKNGFLEFKEESTPIHRRTRTCPGPTSGHTGDEKLEDESESEEDQSEAAPSFQNRRRLLRTEDLQDEFESDEEQSEASPSLENRRRLVRTEDLQEQFASKVTEPTPGTKVANLLREALRLGATDEEIDKIREVGEPEKEKEGLIALIQSKQESLAQSNYDRHPSAVRLEQALGFDCSGQDQQPNDASAFLSMPPYAVRPGEHPHPVFPEILAQLAATGMAPSCQLPAGPQMAYPVQFPVSPVRYPMPMWPPAYDAPCTHAAGVAPPSHQFVDAGYAAGLRSAVLPPCVQDVKPTAPPAHEPSLPAAHQSPAADSPKNMTAEEAPPMMLPASNGRGGRRAPRLWIHIYLHMKVPGFDLVPMLIGRGGCKMRRIAEATGAKLRIRGRGSGHFEVEGKAEAPTPLMVAVTTDHGDQSAFEMAVQMTLDELRLVEDRFKVFCEKLGNPPEGPAFSIGLIPPGMEATLERVLEGVPHAPSNPGRARLEVA